MRQLRVFFSIGIFILASVQFVFAQCDWSGLTAQVQPAGCTGGNTGSITLSGLPVGPGTLYTCQQGTPVSGTNITVGPGEVKRLDVGANLNITINGGTLITCGSISATTLVLSNGGSLIVNGSFTSYQNPTTIPSGCRIVNNNGSLYFPYPVIVNGGMLFNWYGSLTCAATLTNNGGIVKNTSTMYVNGSGYAINYDPNNPGTGTCSITWTGTSQTGSNITNLAPGSYTATFNCGACTTTRTYQVTGGTAPNITINPAASNVCIGSSVTLTASGASTYTWSPATGLNQTTGATVISTPPTSTTYTVTGTNSAGCTATKTVTLSTKSLPVVIVTPSAPTICGSGSVSLTASGATTYSWSTAVGLNQTTGAEVIATLSATRTYNVTGTNTQGCSRTKTVTVTVTPNIELSVNSTAANICVGQSTSLTASGATSYVWSPATGLSSTTDATITATPSTTTTYSVIGTTGSCSATQTTTVTVNSAPQVNVTTTTTASLASCTASATPTVTGGAIPYAYQWTGPNGFTSTQTSLQNICAGNYTLTITDASGCTAVKNFSIESCNFNYTIDKVSPSCLGGNNGTITINGLGTANNNGGGLGTLYTCSDGTPVTGSNIVVGPGEIKRLDGSNTVSSVTINGGTLITCGATWISNQLNISNGGTLFCIGSLTCQPVVNLPAGSKIINIYQSMVFHADVNVSGLLVNVNGSLNCQTNLNIAGKVVNWTDFAATNFNVLNAGTVEHHGRWDSKWGTGIISQGGSFKTYGNSTFAVKDFVHQGSLTAETGTQNCFKIQTSFDSASQGSVTTSSGAQLDFCSAVTIPSSVTIGSGILTNNSSTQCNNCTVYPPDPVDVNNLFGGGNGTACTVTWTGTSQTGASITGLTAGTYVATITCGTCTTIETVVLENGTSNILLTIASTQNPTTSSCDGTATVAISGGQTPYTVEWIATNQTGLTANNLCAGTYSVKATDNVGCKVYSNVVLTNPEIACTGFSFSLNATTASCPEKADGSLTATLMGGQAPLTYLWSTGNTLSANLNDVPAGVYSLKVTDDAGCVYVATKEVVNENSTCTTNPCTAVNLTGTVVKNNDSSCGLSCTGSATATASGGSGTYTYLWNGNAGPANNTTLCPATYTVRIIDQVSKCYKDIANTITIDKGISSVALTIASTQNPTTSSCDGTATVAITGGQTPYTVEWIATNQTGLTASNLCAGAYLVKATDNYGCKGYVTVTLHGTTAPCTDLNVSLTSNMPLCPGTLSGSSIYTNVTGGQAPYKYQWSNGPTSDYASLLSAGNYSVTVTDHLGCEFVATTELLNRFDKCPDGFPCTTVNLAGTVEKISDGRCGSACTGSAVASASGGSGNYYFLWNGVVAPANNTALCPATYTVRIVDRVASCYKDLPNLITINPVVSTLVLTPSTTQNPTEGYCDGTASVSLTGGQDPVTVEWLGIGQLGLSATNLCTGTYSVKATDNLGCTSYSSVTLTDGNTLCTGFTVSLDTNSATCPGKADGSIIASISGGHAPYTYLWSNGNTQSSTLLNAPAGGYNLVVTDIAGCEYTATTELLNQKEICEEPCSSYRRFLVDKISDSDCGTTCNGSATVHEDWYGSEDYICLWNGIEAPANNTSLCPGTYNIRVIENTSHCFYDVINPITINKKPSTVVLALTSSQQPSLGDCNGTATVAVNGGQAPYTINWLGINQTGTTATNLCNGSYLVKVIDNLGCTAYLTVNVNEGICATNVTLQPSHPTCTDKADGSIIATITKANTPIQYTWSNGNTQASSLNNLIEGGYSLNIIDKDGCEFTATTELINQKTPCKTNPCMVNPIVVSVQKNKDSDCPESCNGSATASATGGTGAYIYTWNGNAGLANNTTLCPDTYLVRVIDQSTACYKDLSDAVTINAINTTCDDPACDNFSITADTMKSECPVKATGSITLSVNNGSGDYTITWSNGATATLVQDFLAADTYTITVKDNTTNCQKTIDVIIENKVEVCIEDCPTMTVSVIKKADADCPTTCTGAAEVKATGGSGNYKVLWNGMQAPAIRNNLCAGTYAVQLIDLQNGCFKNSNAPIIIGNRIAQCNPVCTTLCSPVNVEYNALGQYKITCDCTEGCFVISASGAPYANGAWIERPLHDTNIDLQLPCERTQVFIQGKGGPVLTVIPNVTYQSGACTNNGNVHLSISGGSGSYTIHYGGQQSTATDITGLPAGTTIFTVVDNASGASTTLSVLIEAIPQATLTGSILSYWPNGTPKEIKANVTAPATQNTAPYLLDWPALALSNQTPAQTVTLPETYSVSDNPTLQVVLKDKFLCSVSQLIPLVNGCPESFTPSVTKIDPSCYGSKNGSISISNLPVGAQALWTGASVLQTGTTITGIAAGTYGLIITQNNNTPSVCVLYNGSLTLNNPTPLDIAISTAQNNTYTAIATGGTAPITNYLWSNGTQGATATLAQEGTYTVLATDSKGCTITGSVAVNKITCPGVISINRVNPSCFGDKNGSVQGSYSQTGFNQTWTGPGISSPNNTSQTGLGKGNYTFKVSNATCTAYAGVSLIEPLPLTASFEFTAEQGVHILVQNGTAPYTVTWRHDNQTGDVRNDLTLGITYTLDVVDSKGCNLVYSFHYDPCAGNPISLYVLVENNKATPVLSGGTGIYTYAWSALPSGTPLNNSTTAIRTGLANGQYKLLVKDSKACKAEATISIPDCNINFSPVVTNATCPIKCDGKVAIAPQQGITYLWNNNAIGAEFINACSGQHTVLMTTAQGCAIVRSVTVGAGTCTEQTNPCQNNNLSASVLSQVEKTCFSDDSYVNIRVTGGTAPLFYTWTAPLPNGTTETFTSDNSDLENPIPGNYHLDIKDVKGCTTTLDLTVNGPTTGLQANVVETQPVCVGATGSAQVTVLGGKAPYTITWSDQQTGPTRNNLIPGIHNINIQDAVGCKVEKSIAIIEATFVGGIIASQQKMCPGDNIMLTARSASNYTYSWTGVGITTALTQQSINITQVGTYTLTYAREGCNSYTFTTTILENTDCGKKGPICGVVEVELLPYDPNYECLEQQMISATAYGVYRYEQYLEEEKRAFKDNYIDQIMGQAQETLDIEYSDQEGHYTLYYYDQAGNLVRTVPPAGVKTISGDLLTQANTNLKNNTRSVYTDHTLATTYTYNSLNQLIAQDMPDHRKQQLWETGNAQITTKAGENIKDITYTDADKALLIANNSDNAVFFNTTDGGKTWNRVEDLAIDDLKTIQQLDAATVYAVGDNGTFVTSNDGGVNWLVKPVPTEENIIKLYFTTTTDGYLFTESGIMYHTTNGSLTWSAANATLPATIGTETIRAVSAENSDWYVTTSSSAKSRIWHSANNGISWQEETISMPALTVLDADGTGSGFLIGTKIPTSLLRLNSFGETRVLQTQNNDPSDPKGIYSFSDKSFILDKYNRLIGRQVNGTPNEYTSEQLPPGTDISTVHRLPFGQKIAVLTTNNKVIFLNPLSSAGWTGQSDPLIPNVQGITVSGKPILAGTSVTYPMALGEGISVYEVNNNAGWIPLTLQDAPLGVAYKDAWVKGNYKWFLLGTDGNIYQTDIPSLPLPSGANPLSTIKLVPTPVKSNIYKIYPRENSGTLVFALTNAGQIESSTDGITWTNRLTLPAGKTVADLQSFAFRNNGETVSSAAVIFNDNTFFEYVNNVWENRASSFTPQQINAIEVKNNEVWAAGENGEMYSKVSTTWKYEINAGQKQFVTSAGIFPTSIKAITKFNGKIYFAHEDRIFSYYIGQNNIGSAAWFNGKNINVLKSSGNRMFALAGNTLNEFKNPSWNPIDLGTPLFDLSMYGPSQSQVLITSTQGRIYRASATTYIPANLPKALPLNAIASGSGNAVVAVGKDGSVLTSSNGGTTWKPRYSAIASDLISVTAQGNKVVAGAANGKIIYSNNAGISWNFATGTTNSAVKTIRTANGTTVLAIAGNTVLKSTNGGQNFATDKTLEATANGIWIDAEGYGFLVGDNGLAYRITPSGNTSFNYTPVQTDATPDDDKGTGLPLQTFSDVQFHDRMTGYITAVNGKVFKTIDGGAHWKTVETQGASAPILAFNNREQGSILQGDGTLQTLRDRSEMLGSRFWYDQLGRLTLSQNAKQYNIENQLLQQVKNAVPNEGTIRAYSYTLYDDIGRIIEVGELLSRKTLPIFKNESQVNYLTVKAAFIDPAFKREITKTHYDKAVYTNVYPNFKQDNLRPRVASTTYQDLAGASYDRATHYSYDIHGNVKTLVQEVKVNNDLLAKRIDYDYDLVSGKVNQVTYQKNQEDQLLHKYTYDGDNRITAVQTSKDGAIWDTDAKYQYYAHGPLARVELGEHAVETSNYAYTLQGWIKGVQGQNFSYALGYNTADYTSIGNSNGLLPTPVSKPLYNGNIATMATDIPKFGTLGQGNSFDQQFSYDQLNRIKTSQLLTGEGYKTSYMYDPNGNIQALTRNDVNGNELDRLAYNYENKNNAYKYNTNKLRWVDDAVQTAANNTDIEDQSIDNYNYDDIGNLLKDEQEEIENIAWTVYGKVESVKRTANSTKPDLSFAYDASGNRVAKTITKKDGSITTTFYIRDASGNTMAVYEKENQGALPILAEQHIYGSQRLGMIKPTTASLQNGTHTTGLKSYELSDHLGNVSVVLSDYKVGSTLANVKAAYNYYPFGMSARSYNASDYRYGYNGKELDAEGLGGSGATYDYGFRIYNPNIARFLSVDPLTQSYPWYTPYQFAGNNPIQYIDLDGLEQKEVKTDILKTKPELKVGDNTTIQDKVFKVVSVVMNKNAYFYSDHVGAWDAAGKDYGATISANTLPFPYNTQGLHDIPVAYVIDNLNQGFNDPRIHAVQGNASSGKVRMKVYVNTTYTVVYEHNPPPKPKNKPNPIIEPVNPGLVKIDPVTPDPVPVFKENRERANLDIEFDGNSTDYDAPGLSWGDDNIDTQINPIVAKLKQNSKNFIDIRVTTQYAAGAVVNSNYATSQDLVAARGAKIKKSFTDKGVSASQINIIIDKGSYSSKSTQALNGTLHTFTEVKK